MIGVVLNVSTESTVSRVQGCCSLGYRAVVVS